MSLLIEPNTKFLGRVDFLKEGFILNVLGREVSLLIWLDTTFIRIVYDHTTSAGHYIF